MKRKVINVIRYFIFLLLMLVILFPLGFILMASFKSNAEIFNSPWSFPEEISLKGYRAIIETYNIGRNLINSLLYSAGSCAVSIAVSSMASYAITRMRWRFSKAALNYLLLGIMVPMHSLLVPLYVSVSKLKLPSPAALLLIYIAGAIPTAVFIMTGFLESVPYELEEAAVIDGASIKKCFFSVILPLLKPSIATVGILTFMNVWNDLLMGLIFLRNQSHYTIQLFIAQFKGSHATNYPVLLASIIASAIPMIIIYLIMSDRLIDGITQGAVKG